MTWILKSARLLCQGSYGASYFSGSGFVGDQRRAVRFGRRTWAIGMARALRRYDMRVVKVRRVRA